MDFFIELKHSSRILTMSPFFFLRKTQIEIKELNSHLYILNLVSAWESMLNSPLLVQNFTNKFGIVFSDRQVLSIAT